MRQQTYMTSLDSVRGLAAAMVVFHHFQIMPIWANNRWFANANLMVDLFFVLSGFVIAFSYCDKITDKQSLFDFQKKRFWRLYPLHLLMLMVFLGIEVANYFLAQIPNHITLYQSFTDNNITTFISNVFLTHSLGLHDTVTFNRASWSISVEFYTYLLFALATILSTPKLRIPVYAGLSMLGALVLIAFGTRLTYIQDMGFFRCIYSFFAGSVCYHIYAYLRERNKQSHPIVTIALLITAIVAIVYGNNRIHFLLPGVFSLLILSITLENENSIVNAVLQRKPFRYLGKISYSIYLGHGAVWWLTIEVLLNVFKLPTYLDHRGWVKFDVSPWLSIPISLVGFSLIILLSDLTYRFVEDRFRIKSKKKTMQSPVTQASEDSPAIEPAFLDIVIRRDGSFESSNQKRKQKKQGSKKRIKKGRSTLSS